MVNKMNIEIFRANEIDLTNIDKIENSLDKRILSYNILKNNLDDNNYYIYIAKFNNIVVGYISFVFLIDHIDIDSIAVIPEYRKNKIGTLLLNKLFEVSKELNVNNIFLEVRKSNIPAVLFYEKMGFKKINIRKDYYLNPTEDAVIYKKLI